ncbi:MAG: helix-hairpin-helix domain-containing protein [Ignavibacteria bacterium]|nr:helix-hairpin-helix domain-containing protein [Ignavibacteria bacterium]MBT8382345.1 helix-hairpin-helix domain-containing protein [Ignavibacteria bacterium]MBT8390325.1 helix-hairpin-helix domain-containing protein [Ignavibacteria bacterium]NNJ53345.1 helix-hairpin-helix domain-containing protein [Ignavibacteriaceae bacterium]NNL22475.1 helix-hairpin-helix domain-containing protein [Ignavibacteriaceae bacterium]
MIEKISKKIGFTPTEIKVILFLVCIFIVGYFYKEYFIEEVETEYVEYDYSEQDSLFNYFSSTNPEEREDLTLKKNLEIKREVLELSERDFDTKEKLPPLVEKSININIAGIEELVRLPGIGEKTAIKIIALRNIRGKFANLKELKDVKGIGEVKFNKIKKFLYIE